MSVFIIAECGVNWRDLVDADDMIREAANSGADAVKFQAYTKVQVAPHERARELWNITLDESTIRYLYWRCQQHGIEFMCTPMYPEAVAMLDPYVKRWKIRYADRDNEELISLCKATGKPMLISGKNIYCNSEYPPKPDWMPSLSSYDGFSSHWPDIDFVTEVMTYNPELKYLEVHVRLDKYEPHYCPIDTKVSITMGELKELCERLK